MVGATHTTPPAMTERLMRSRREIPVLPLDSATRRSLLSVPTPAGNLRAACRTNKWRQRSVTRASLCRATLRSEEAAVSEFLEEPEHAGERLGGVDTKGRGGIGRESGHGAF